MGAFLRDVAQSIRMLRERRGFGASSGDFFDGRRGTADAGALDPRRSVTLENTTGSD
jgi:hypothetical protein